MPPPYAHILLMGQSPKWTVLQMRDPLFHRLTHSPNIYQVPARARREEVNYPSCLSRRLKIPIYLSQRPSSPCWESRDVPPSEDSSQPQGPAWEGPASPVGHLPRPGLSPAWPAQWAGRTHSSRTCSPAPTVPANPGQAGNDWGRDRK